MNNNKYYLQIVFNQLKKIKKKKLKVKKIIKKKIKVKKIKKKKPKMKIKLKIK
jgi:hypothetical protein